MNKKIVAAFKCCYPYILAGLVMLFFWQFTIKPVWLQAHLYTLDDAFISYHYADNLNRFSALVWNKGEHPPVEGYTSILWVLIVAGIQWLGLAVVYTVKIISVGSIFVAAALIFYFLLKSGGYFPKAIAAYAALVFFLMNADLVVHMLSGMETALAILLSTTFFIEMISLNQPLVCQQKFSPSLAMRCSIIGLLCALNRPEFNLAFLVTSIALCVQQKNYRQLIIVFLIAPYVLLGGCYMAWRLYYYGPLLPLPFYIKVASESLAGIRNVGAFFMQIWPILPWLIVTQFSAVNRRVLAPMLLGLLSLSVFFLFPAPIMGIANRFMIPLYGILCVIAGMGVQQLLAWSRTIKWQIVVVLLALVSVFGLYQFNTKDQASGMQWYGEGLLQAHGKLAKALAPYGENHTIAMGDAGTIAYFSKWQIIDTFGLNNRAIAQVRAKGQYDPHLVIDQQPDILVLISTQCNPLVSPMDVNYEQQLFTAALAVGYQAVGTIEFKPSYYLKLYTQDKPFTNDLVRKLQASGVFSACQKLSAA